MMIVVCEEKEKNTKILILTFRNHNQFGHNILVLKALVSISLSQFIPY